MFKVEEHIQIDELMRWTQSWDEAQYIHYYERQIDSHDKRRQVSSSMEETIVKIKKLCRDMGPDLNFNALMQLMNRIVFNCYFKQGNSALSVANYYEEILVPADQKTRNRILGVEDGVRKVGRLELMYEGEQVGELSEQSDLFRLIFDASFLSEDELFDENELPFNADGLNQMQLATDHAHFLTLKIWSPQVAQDREAFVDLMLFHCSTKLDLNLKRSAFETPVERAQPPLHKEIHCRPLKLEKLPLLYFNSASHNLAPEIVLMSYYHTLSYFFERAINVSIRDKMREMFSPRDLSQNKELRRMSKAVNSLRDNFSEKEALRLLFERSLDFDAFMGWLAEVPERKSGFLTSQSPYEELPVLSVSSRKKLLKSLVNRVYSLKATLAEERERQEYFIWIEQIDDTLLEQEIPLMRWLAAQTLEVWSAVDQ